MPNPPVAAVEVEEDVYACTDAKNGARPQWCFGSTVMVRVGEDVFISGNEVIPDAKPLNNTRWTLFRRSPKGPVELVYRDAQGRTREPSPIGAFPGDGGGRVFVTANPTLAAIDAYSGPATPTVFEFSANGPAAAPKVLNPVWSEPVTFTEHSYRSFAVDGPGREFIYFNNIGYDLAHWSFFDAQGAWSASGKIHWPRHGEGAASKPLRVCYPSVALCGKAVYFFGISDIVEPNPEFKAFKFALTKSEWDYVFCRTFFSWTPDVTREPFRPWVEVASREETRGTMLTGDLWAGSDGTTHLLWTEVTLDQRLRDKFYPGQKVHWQLNYAQVRDGVVSNKRSLIDAVEGEPGPRPDWGRFHATPSGRLLVIATVQTKDAHGVQVEENQVMELDAAGKPGPATTIKLEHAFSRLFFTATPRGGSAPSKYLDLAGQCAGRPNTIRYARVRVE